MRGVATRSRRLPAEYTSGDVVRVGPVLLHELDPIVVPGCIPDPFVFAVPVHRQRKVLCVTVVGVSTVHPGSQLEQRVPSRGGEADTVPARQVDPRPCAEDIGHPEHAHLLAAQGRRHHTVGILDPAEWHEVHFRVGDHEPHAVGTGPRVRRHDVLVRLPIVGGDCDVHVGRRTHGVSSTELDVMESVAGLRADDHEARRVDLSTHEVSDDVIDDVETFIRVHRRVPSPRGPWPLLPASENHQQP